MLGAMTTFHISNKACYDTVNCDSKLRILQLLGLYAASPFSHFDDHDDSTQSNLPPFVILHEE